MDIENIAVGTILITDAIGITPLARLTECGIEIVGIDPKGFKCKRLHPFYNGEEFFLTIDAMKKSHWIEVPKCI